MHSLMPLIVFLAFFVHFVSLILALVHNRDFDGPLLESYDYIICGCGISGLVTARRLTESPDVNVLCIEAGTEDVYTPDEMYPVHIGDDIKNYDWGLVTVPQLQLDGKSRPFPQGKALGGGSVINGMVWARGGRDDFDAWADLGNPEWDWNNLFNYFRKSENFTSIYDETTSETYQVHHDPDVHGYDGPVHVSYARYLWPQSQNFFDALNSLGVPTSYDPNSGDPVGAAFLPSDIHPENQTRFDARRAYYDPVASRLNLHIIFGQHVTRILNDRASGPASSSPSSGASNRNGNDTKSGLVSGPDDPPILRPSTKSQPRANSELRIIGVEFGADSSATRQIAWATREVILAAGAVHSPQILQLSGIGPAKILKPLNITVSIDLPGVGQNLQDHCLVGTYYPYNNQSYPMPNALKSNATFNAEAEAEYVANKTGPWTAGAVNALAFPSLLHLGNLSAGILENASYSNAIGYLPPDLDENVLRGYMIQRSSIVRRLGLKTVGAYEIINTNAGELTLSLMHPLSRGYTNVISINPFEPPSIDPRWFTDPTDRAIMVAGLLFNREILATPSMQLLQPAQLVPKLNASLGDIIWTIDNNTQTEFHVSGTTAMLPLNQGGVVDSRGRVYGTQNLRIVDAGIIPIIPAGHLMAPVYAIAERLSDMIKDDNLTPVLLPRSVSLNTASTTTTLSTAIHDEASITSSLGSPSLEQSHSSTSSPISGVYGPLPDERTISAFLEDWFHKVFPRGLNR